MEPYSLKRTLALVAVAAASVAGTAAIATMASGAVIPMARAQGAYSCASIHFGMDDATLTGPWSGDGTTWAPTLDGVKVLSHENNEHVYFSKGKALKFNSGSKFDGEITLTLDMNVRSLTAYAAGWANTNPALSVNGVSHDVPACADVHGNSGPATYTPIEYVLPAETNVLTLAATTERVVVGDLALRVTSPAEEETSQEQGQTTVTFSQAELAGASPISKNGVKLENSSDYKDTKVTELRIYKNQTLTIAADNGHTLKGITFECTANGTSQYGPGCFAAIDGYSCSGKTGTWEGSAQSVTLTASSAQVRITSLTASYI